MTVQYYLYAAADHGPRRVRPTGPDDPFMVFVPAAAFQIASSAADYATGSVPETDGGIWSFASAPHGMLAAPVMLPIGTRIRSITWHFHKGWRAAPLTMQLRRRIGTTNTVLSAICDTSRGPSWVSATSSDLDYTILSEGTLWLHVAAGHSAQLFGWADLTCDVPGAACA